MFRLIPALASLCFIALAGCTGTAVSFANLKNADVAEMRGTLHLPEGRGPHPAVILLHGCGGLRPNAAMWAGFLKANGYAALVLDGFGPRGVTEICTNFNRVPPQQRVRDSYAALRYLATRPDIAADRVALMGFSNGAVVVLDAASRFWGGQITDTTLRFRAGVALYPECRNRLSDYGTPVMIQIGDRDDWTLASSCTELQQRLQPESQPLALRVYPGGLHAFDDLTGGGYLPHVRNINSPSGYGATTGGDRRSLERAKADLLDYLRQQLAEK